MPRFVSYPPLFLALAMLAGCGDAKSCAQDRDCFAGEVCSDAVCVVGFNAVNNVSAGSNNETTAAPDRDTDVVTTNNADRPDAGPDAAPGDDMEPDTTTTQDTGAAECTIDPFTFTCTDDAFEPNNEWIDGHHITGSTIGCNPDFEPVSTSFVATMCPLDGSDYYYVNFVACSAAYVIEWQVQPESDCDPALIGFESFSWDCDEPFVQCSTIDGKPTVRIIVDETTFPNLQSTYVQVHNKGADNVTFDYRISLTVRQ